MGTRKLSEKPDEMLGGLTCDGLASPSRRSSNTLSLYATETGIRSGGYASQVHNLTFFM